MSFSEKFNNLSASQKRWVMGSVAIAVILGISVALASVSERKTNRVPRANKPEVTVVSPARTTGVEGFSAELLQLKKEQEAMKSKYERMLKEREPKPFDSAADSKPAAEPLETIPELTPQTSVFDAPVAKGPSLPPPPPDAAPPTEPLKVGGEAPASNETVPVAPVVRAIKVTTEKGEVGDDKEDNKLNIPPSTVSKKAAQPESAFVPAGSMFAGVLLSGLDAPTSGVAQKNPTPVVVRVKREAVLPNYASIDVRECFVMAAGYGQLSTERAILRAETLSCVRSDGQVIESTIDAYIVGTDGKVGIPGRLVSKQGQMIAQTLIAGTLGGIGQTLGRSRVPALNLNPETGHSLYEAETASSVFQSGVSGGIGAATNMIAKFYLDMAKETFPVVEVPAGEVVTVVVTRGSTLPLKGSASLQRVTGPGDQQGQRAATQHRQEKPATTAQDAMAPGEAALKAMGQAIPANRNARVPAQGQGVLGW